MRIKVKSKHLTLTPALEEYATKKLSHIQKYCDQILSAEVMLCTERNFHRVEVTMHMNGLIFRGEEKTDNMYSSIDKVIDKLERQVRKHKEKLQDHRSRPAENLIPSVTPTLLARIVSRKQRMMHFSPEEAAEELERLGLNFYLFQNRETDHVNVIYRRENGNLAVLEPIP